MPETETNAPKRSQSPQTEGGWQEGSTDYFHLTQDRRSDSRYLREHGLFPNMLRLLGDCSDRVLLDAGCGDGWLLDRAQPKEGHGFDLVLPHVSRIVSLSRWSFTAQDLQGPLTYPTEHFDACAASLVLMWLEDIERTLRELHRVTKPGGRLVVSIMHPAFYRTGQVLPDGSYRVTADLSQPFAIEDLRIGDRVGPFRYWYRPLEDYLNAHVRTGWRICETRSWSVDMTDYADYADGDVFSGPPGPARTGNVPMYFFLACERL